MTPDEIRHVYAAGPEAVIALVTRLLITIVEQSQQTAALAARVQTLEQMTGR